MTDDMMHERRYIISNGDVPMVWKRQCPTSEEVIELLRLGHSEVGFVQKMAKAIEEADTIRGGDTFRDLHPHLADALRCPASCPRVTTCPLKAA